MKSIFHLSLIGILLSLVSCSSDDSNMQEIMDTEAPEFVRVLWIDNPAIENDPAGDIVDNSNHTISIQSGFQLLIDVRDDNLISSGEVFFTVNNDPNIKEVIFSPELTIDSNQSGAGFTHRVDRIWLGPDEWYTLKAGDTFQFSASYTDEFNNKNRINWTADIVE